MLKRYKMKEVKPVKFNEMYDSPVKESEGHRPTVYLSSKEIPALKDWENGGSYGLTVKMVSRSEDKDGRVSGSFEVVAAGDEEE